MFDLGLAAVAGCACPLAPAGAGLLVVCMTGVAMKLTISTPEDAQREQVMC